MMIVLVALLAACTAQTAESDADSWWWTTDHWRDDTPRYNHSLDENDEPVSWGRSHLKDDYPDIEPSKYTRVFDKDFLEERAYLHPPGFSDEPCVPGALMLDPYRCFAGGGFGVVTHGRLAVTVEGLGCRVVDVAAKAPVWWSEGKDHDDKDPNRRVTINKNFIRDHLFEYKNLRILEDAVEAWPDPEIVRHVPLLVDMRPIEFEELRNAVQYEDDRHNRKCFPYNSWGLIDHARYFPIILTAIVPGDMSLFRLLHSKTREWDDITEQEVEVYGRPERLRRRYPQYANELIDIFIGIAKGWKILHNASLIHRDLCVPGKNMLVRRDSRGVTGTIIDVGGAYYCPKPEQQDALAFAKKIEMYQYGNMIYQSCFGRRPHTRIKFHHNECGYDHRDADTYRKTHAETHEMRPEYFRCTNGKVVKTLLDGLFNPVLESRPATLTWDDVIKLLEHVKDQQGHWHIQDDRND